MVTAFTKDLTDNLNLAPYMSYIGGDSEVLGLEINDNDYSDTWMDITINERLNEAPTATIALSTDPSMSADITNYKLVRIYYDSTEIFKGYIQRIDYNSDEKSTLHCIQAAAVKLMNYFVGVGSGATKNQGYRKTSTQIDTMVSNLISVDYTGTSKDIVDDGTNDVTTSVNFYAENMNRLQAIRKLARQNGCEIWFGVDGSDNDQLNFSDERGTGSTVKTFYTHGTNMNCDAIKRLKDTTMLWNTVKVVGYGDGDRQAMSIDTDTTTASDTLNGAITITDTTITLNSSSGFTATGGVILIESEIIEYTGISTNDLTGCIRGTHGTDEATHANTTVVVEHPYYEENSTSQSSYGTRQKRWADKAIKGYAEANTLAAKILADHKDPINRFTIKTYDFDEILPSVVDVGDTITIDDNSIFQSGDATTYKVMSRIININLMGESITLECASRTYTFIEEMQEVFEEAEDMSRSQQINELVKAFLDNAGVDDFLDNAGTGAFLNNQGISSFLSNSGTHNFVDDATTGSGTVDGAQTTTTASNSHTNQTDTVTANAGFGLIVGSGCAGSTGAALNINAKTEITDGSGTEYGNYDATDKDLDTSGTITDVSGVVLFLFTLDLSAFGQTLTIYINPDTDSEVSFTANTGFGANPIVVIVGVNYNLNAQDCAVSMACTGTTLNDWQCSWVAFGKHDHTMDATDIVDDAGCLIEKDSLLTIAVDSISESTQAALNNTTKTNALNNTTTGNALTNTSTASGLNNTSTDNAVKKTTG